MGYSKRRECSAIFLISLMVFIFISSTSANLLKDPNTIPYKIPSSSIVYPVYMKNATVKIDCFENEVKGYGRYEIVSVDPTPIDIPISFMHFYWEYFYHTGNQITSVKVNGTEIPYTTQCSYDSTCQNEAIFSMSFSPLDTLILEVTWQYNPKVSNMFKTYLLGYVIFSEGWNRSIVYEEVTFFFHSDVFYRGNKINLYSSDFEYQVGGYSGCNLNEFAEETCASQKRFLRYLARTSDLTKLEENQGVPYYKYCDYDIETNHNLLIIHLGWDTNILLWVISGILGIVTIGFFTGSIYLKKKASSNSR